MAKVDAAPKRAEDYSKFTVRELQQLRKELEKNEGRVTPPWIEIDENPAQYLEKLKAELKRFEEEHLGRLGLDNKLRIIELPLVSPGIDREKIIKFSRLLSIVRTISELPTIDETITNAKLKQMLIDAEFSLNYMPYSPSERQLLQKTITSINNRYDPNSKQPDAPLDRETIDIASVGLVQNYLKIAEDYRKNGLLTQQLKQTIQQATAPRSPKQQQQAQEEQKQKAAEKEKKEDKEKDVFNKSFSAFEKQMAGEMDEAEQEAADKGWSEPLKITSEIAEEVDDGNLDYQVMTNHPEQSENFDYQITQAERQDG